MTALGNIAKGAALGALWLYKRTLSPVLYFFGARCRHYPSCSDYAAEAFHQHSPWRAFWLTLSRLSRCHPFGSHGIDPVPKGQGGAWWQIWRLGDWAWTERGGDESNRDETNRKARRP
ncbi:Membrane protein insertion efficiency factor YidD [hydrothermal vent metagenome]|uniref:Membrane protein insertion efficiency factor YidD n=1 Tax=hydrothermal vent metagenome TaxID=652676 RepID=A0A3B0SL35_9ZZZZ